MVPSCRDKSEPGEAQNPLLMLPPSRPAYVCDLPMTGSYGERTAGMFQPPRNPRIAREQGGKFGLLDASEKDMRLESLAYISMAFPMW